MTINIISESNFSIKGHGVHSVFEDNSKILAKHYPVSINSFKLNYNVVHCHTVGLFSLYHALFGKGKKIVTVHVVEESFDGSFKFFKYWRRLATWYLKFFYNRFDIVVAISEKISQKVINEYKISSSRTVTIPNLIDKEVLSDQPKQSLRDKYHISLDDYVVTTVGQFQPRKNPELFISLAKKMPEVKFIWVGSTLFKRSGESTARMNRLLTSLPSNMTNIAHTDRNTVMEYLKLSDVFVLLSKQENDPVSVIEATANGLPVVLNRQAGYVANYQGSLLAVDPNMLMNTITELQNSSSLQDSMSNNSLQYFKKYNDNNVQKLLDLYKGLE